MPVTKKTLNPIFIMAEYVAFNKSVEVNGQTILSVLDGMTGFEFTAKQILSNNGITNIVKDKWYSQQAWLNAFNEIAMKIGNATVTKIGRMIPKNAQWPPNVDSIFSAFQSIDIAYHMNHRLHDTILFDKITGKCLPDIGNYKYSKLSKNSIKMVCNNPYPCSFDKGIIKAVAEKFKPKGYKLIFKENTKQSCRSNGDEYCIYIISWEKSAFND